jgi:hypothetical protein
MSVIPAAKNEPDEIKLRKFRDTLVTGGFAIIAFGIWTVIKIIMEAFTILQPMIGSLSFEGLSQLETEQLQAMIEDGSLFHFLLFTILGFLIVDLIVRIYVGYSARAIGLQKKTRSGKKRSGIVWLIFGIILVSIGIYSLVITLSDTSEILQEHSIIYYVISLFVDVTSLFVTAEVIITGFRFRVLSKKQENIEEVQDAA